MWLKLVFFFLPILYFLIYRAKNKENTFFEDFKTFFGIKKITSNSFYKGLFLLVILFVVSILINLVVHFIFPSYNDLGNVSNTILSYIIGGQVLYFFFILVIGVFLEEFFFRSFLVPRIGVFFSTLAFALLHYGYNSYVEMIGAFVLGLVLAYFYKKNKDLFVNFYGHLLYNVIVIILTLITVV